MKTVIGVDFTSAPSPRKPVVWAEGVVEDGELRVLELRETETLAELESWWGRPGPWLAAVDLPLSLPIRFWDRCGWGGTWRERVARVAAMRRSEWREYLRADRAQQAPGDKQPKREVDRLAKACSPLMVAPVPVALMFQAGAPRLLRAGVTVCPLWDGDPGRVVVEAYPALVARFLAGAEKGTYKTEGVGNDRLKERRRAMVRRLGQGALEPYGLRVSVKRGLRKRLVEEARGDHLDAVLALVQAGWAVGQGGPDFGCGPGRRSGEGWIADPFLHQ